MEADIQLAAQVVAGVLGLECLDGSPVTDKGLVNLIFFARSSAGITVVRLNKPDDIYRGLAFYEKEGWCLEKAASLGIPGPTVLAIGSCAGRPYMLQSFVPGSNGHDLPSAKPDIWRALGRYAKKIHSVRLNGFGETLEKFHAGNAIAEWQRYVRYNLDSLTAEDELIRLNVYQPSDAAKIREWFLGLLTQMFVFGLNHGDLSPRNTVVDDNGQIYLLDWGQAVAALVPHYDFKLLVDEIDPGPSDLQAFLDGYEMDEAEFARLLPEMRAFRLLKAFDVTRWAIARRPEVIAEKVQAARTILQGMLSN